MSLKQVKELMFCVKCLQITRISQDYDDSSKFGKGYN